MKGVEHRGEISINNVQAPHKPNSVYVTIYLSGSLLASGGGYHASHHC